MITFKSLLKLLIRVKKCNVKDAETEFDEKGNPAALIIKVKPYKKDDCRCPICGKKSPGYDTVGTRRWRAPDFNEVKVYIVRAEYGSLKKRMREYNAVKENIDSILSPNREQEQDKAL